MPANPYIVWLRDDLRLEDHAALAQASRQGPVLPVYVWDKRVDRCPGAASRWWLHHSLQRLSQSIEEQGGTLLICEGDTTQELGKVARQFGAAGIYFSRSYEPGLIELESELHQEFGGKLDVKRFAGRLLCEPENLANLSGKPYRVFTPFWRALQRQMMGATMTPADHAPTWFSATRSPLALDELALLPVPNWASAWEEHWSPGERGAAANLNRFVESPIGSYDNHRDRPDLQGTSRLSAHLHFGEISPAQVWRAITFEMDAGTVPEAQGWAFLREIGWREFSNHLLFHFPTFPTRNHRTQFDHFPWRDDPAGLKAWQRGLTGFPIVDAGMRELWQTGWMHNRVRMIVGSFLVKDLMIDWRQGEAWFWDTLVDADLANNSSGWQWIAGSGADAAPFFRIFNPMTQGEKFDPHGRYVRRWVPEVAALPNKWLNRPWEAPVAIREEAGFNLGVDYPGPIVDHAQARKAALVAFKSL